MNEYLIEFTNRIVTKHGADTPVALNDIPPSIADKIYSATYSGKETMDMWVRCELLNTKNSYWSDTIRDLKNRMLDIFFAELSTCECKTFGEFIEKVELLDIESKKQPKRMEITDSENRCPTCHSTGQDGNKVCENCGQALIN